MNGYYNKERSMSKVLQEIEEKRGAFTRALKTRKYLLDFIATIPDDLFPEMDHFNSSVYTYSNTCDISMYFPWDIKLIKRVKSFLRKHSENVIESDADDKSRTLLSINKVLSNDFSLRINASFQVSTKGSTCVLVPLKTHTETRTVVEIYDRICPEGHPELFEERDGELVYIGDSFAPANEAEG